MKTRTNQPVFLDNGNPVDDSKLGGTQLYKHHIVIDFLDEDENDNQIYCDIFSLSSTSFNGSEINPLEIINLVFYVGGDKEGFVTPNEYQGEVSGGVLTFVDLCADIVYCLYQGGSDITNSTDTVSLL